LSRMTSDFLECQVVTDRTGNLLPKATVDTVRFAFTHQLYQDIDKGVYTKACTEINRRLKDGDFSEITKMWTMQYTDWINYMETQHTDGVINKQLKEMLKHKPNFDADQQKIKTLAQFVKVVKVYICMESIVTICTIDKSHVTHVHSVLMSWVERITRAYKAKQLLKANIKALDNKQADVVPVNDRSSSSSSSDSDSDAAEQP
jgi:hypothetical protein